MKKALFLAAMAFAAVACNNAEEVVTEETTAVEEVVSEEADTEVVAEEVTEVVAE